MLLERLSHRIGIGPTPVPTSAHRHSSFMSSLFSLQRICKVAFLCRPQMLKSSDQGENMRSLGLILSMVLRERRKGQREEQRQGQSASGPE